jgi:type I restriction enzyme S subunit
MREGWTYKKFEDCLVKAPKAKQVQTSQYNTGTKYPIVSQEDTLISGYFDDDAYLYHIDNPIVVFGDHTRVLKYIDFDFVVGADGVKILIPKEFLNAKLLYYYLLWYKIPNLGYSRHYKLLKEH